MLRNQNIKSQTSRECDVYFVSSVVTTKPEPETFRFSLPGSGSGLNRQDVKRSNSMHQSYHGGHGGGHGNRRFRDRDLNVKLSRGIQTSLTKDAMTEDADDAEDRVVTDVNFSLYMPDVLGGDTGANDVETHVTEPTEPVDVRRNRQVP